MNKKVSWEAVVRELIAMLDFVRSYPPYEKPPQLDGAQIKRLDEIRKLAK